MSQDSKTLPSGVTEITLENSLPAMDGLEFDLDWEEMHADKVCECGAEVLKSDKHSYYCPKHKEGL